MRWLHLSDLHLLYKDYDTNIMRESFLEYLKKNFKEIDCLFITGDITHQGHEYTEDEVFGFLTEIVSVLGLSKEKVYLIPGNHDIHRTELMGTVIKGILSSEDCKKAINEIEDETFNVLYKGQQSFINLYKRFLGRDYPEDNIHFVISTNEYNVIHINTCLIAGGDDVDGKILIGLEKLFNAIKEVNKETEKVTFALGHHTIDCLHVAEKSSFLNRLADKKVDFYLNGHVHKSGLIQESNNIHTLYSFTAGSNVVDSYSDTLFIEGSLNTKSGEGEVIYHTWNSNQEYWHVNTSLDRRLAEGKYRFELEKFKKNTLSSKGNFGIKSVKSIGSLDGLEFKNFLVNFHNVLSKDAPTFFEETFEQKDVRDKFEKMRCSTSLKKQYDSYATYFPLINEIFKTSSFVGFEKKHLIPSLISKYYFKELHNYSNGDQIFVAMVEGIVDKYSQKMDLSEEALEMYISILIYWEIHECDIYNENKEEVVP